MRAIWKCEVKIFTKKTRTPKWKIAEIYLERRASSARMCVFDRILTFFVRLNENLP